MTKPTTDFLWADNPSTLRTEPPEGTKDTGFAVNARLPAQYFNWLLGVCGDWLTWVNSRVFDGYTLVSVGADTRLYGDPDAGMYVEDNVGGLVPVQVSKVRLATDPYELEVVAGALEVRDSTTAYIPVACGNPAVSTNALTRQYQEIWARATGGVVSISSETVLPFVAGGVVFSRGITLGTGGTANQFSVNVAYGEGVYRVRAVGKWAAKSGAGARTLAVRKNGATVESVVDQNTDTGAATGQTQVVDCLLEITDYQNDYIDLSGTSGVGSDGMLYASIEIHRIGGPTT